MVALHSSSHRSRWSFLLLQRCTSRGGYVFPYAIFWGFLDELGNFRRTLCEMEFRLRLIMVDQQIDALVSLCIEADMPEAL